MGKYLHILVLILVWCATDAVSQQIYTRSTSEPSIQKYTLPSINNNQLKNTELALRKKGRANQFAHPNTVHIDIHTHGTWEYLENDLALWRMQISSKDALSINLGFSEFLLPMSAQFYIINGQSEQPLGPFTKSGTEDHSQLWTPIIESDHIILELQVPIDDIKKTNIILKYINHGYLGFSANSGSCNLDVICGEMDGFPEVENYRDIIQSVGAYSLNGISICSGVLINNANNDCTPYFLTANHCEIDGNNAGSVVVYWNYQNSTCRTPGSLASGDTGDGTLASFNSGSTFRAANEASDMCLIELDDPIDPTNNPFLAGWSNVEQLYDQAICIHHPDVKEKRISFENDPLDYELDEDENITGIMVNDWDTGTTESGSSGAPLFNKNKQIIGQLRGGQASCENELFDVFGAFFQSWEGGNTPETSLKYWLDPNNTGIQSMDGKYCSFIVSISESQLEYCSNNVDQYTLDITVNDNFSGNVQLGIDSEIENVEYIFGDNPIRPGQSTTLTIKNLSSVPRGTRTFNVIASDGSDENFIGFTLIVNDATPSDIEPLFPIDGTEGLSPLLRLSWSGTADAYDVQVSLDQNFSSLIFNQNAIDDVSFQVQDLDPVTKYFWRVRGRNICGIGNWTDPQSFNIGKVNCHTIYAADLPRQITDATPVTILSDIFFPYGGTMTKLSVVDIKGTHTWVSDLTLRIQNPDGESITLIENACSDEDDFDFNLSGDALNESIECPFNTKQTYQPNEDLNRWIGSNPQGVWTFILMDDFAQDGGRFDGWGIQICLDYSTDYSIVTPTSLIEACNVDQSDIDIYIGAGFDSDVRLTSDNNPSDLDVTFTPNPAPPGTRVRMRINGYAAVESGLINLEYSGTDGSQTSNSTIQINKPFAPTPAQLLLPVNDAIDLPLDDIAFSWMNMVELDKTIFQVSTDPNFIELLINVDIEESSYSPSLEFEKATRYYWRVVTNNECDSSNSPVFSFVTELDVSTHDLAGTDVSIFPNPADQTIHISIRDLLKSQASFTLMDVAGRIVMNGLLNHQKKSNLSIAHLNGGIYVLKVSSGESSIVEKIVVQH